MRLTAFALTVAVLVVATNANPTTLNFDAPALSDEIINTVNSVKGGTWKAGRNAAFEDKTLGDVFDMLSHDDYSAFLQTAPEFDTSVLSGNAPESFDARHEWEECIEGHVAQDQGRCGSCWAFSLAQAHGIRFCIHSDGAINVPMSPQYITSCDKNNGGCQGGTGPVGWDFLVNQGCASRDCVAYTSGNGQVPECPDVCDDGSDMVLYKAKDPVERYPNDEAQLREIYSTQGPAYTRLDVYEDFMAYTSGVYQHTTGSLLGGHAVTVIGWGEEDGTDYWLIANSWGTNWGIDGNFKIIRGVDDCGIEAGNVGALPDIPAFPKFADLPKVFLASN